MSTFNPDQQQPNQGAPNQPYPNQPYPNQPYPNQPYPNQPYPNQPYPNQPYPNQPYPNQPYPNYPYPNMPYPAPAAGNTAARQAGRIVSRIIAAVLLAIGAIFFLVGSIFFMSKLGKEDATGRIVRISTTASGDHQVIVDYKAGTNYYHAQLDEWHSDWVTGQEIAIKYDPDDPTKIVTASHLIDGIFGGIGGVFLALGFFILLKKPKAASGIPQQVS